MKLVGCSIVFGLCVFGLLNEQSKAIDLLYDFEGDSGTTAHDKLTSDGAQNGTAHNAVTLNNTSDPGWGSQTAFFDNPPPPVSAPYSTFEVPNTTFGANYSVRLAGWVNQDQVAAGLRRFRVFSSFLGTGATNNSLLLDASNANGASKIRAIVNNVTFNGPNNSGVLSASYHH